jgi:hypothetical protein
MKFDPKKLKIIRSCDEADEWYDIEESGSFRPVVYSKALYLGEVYRAPYEDFWQIDLCTNDSCREEFPTLKAAREWLEEYLERWLCGLPDDKYAAWCTKNKERLEEI